MKKTTQAKVTKGDRTRARILKTAVKMMADKGPDEVSMRELAAGLKITKPVLYYYFKDKKELIHAVFHEGTRHFREMNQLVLRETIPLEKKIAMFLGSHLDFFKKNPDMPKCALKIMAAASHGTLSGMAMEMKKEHREMLRQVIKKAADRGEIAKGTESDVAHLLGAAITHFIIEAKEGNMAALDNKLPSRLARIICAGAKVLAVAALLTAFPTERANSATLELNVNQAVDTALKNNATVAVAQATHSIYKEKVREYWGTVFPQMSASAQYTRNIESPSFFIGGNKLKVGLNNAYTGSLDLNQVLWAGGKVYTAIKMANIYSASSDEQLKTARQTIARSVKQMYYAVLLSSSIAEIQRESLNLASQHLATIEAQYKQGLASDLSVLRQKVEVSNTEPALTQAQNLYEEGLIELKNLLGLDPESDIKLTDSLTSRGTDPGNIDELYKAALMNRPEYLNQKLQRDLYREMVTIEKAGHYPYLSAYASKQFQGQSDSGFPGSTERSWSLTAGLRLSLPLFSGGSVVSKVKQARTQADIAETNLKELERRIKIEVKKAWLGSKEASERLRSQTTAVETARKALSATELRFKNGLSSQLELNDASLALNRSRTLYIQALHDTCSADAELEWVLGSTQK